MAITLVTGAPGHGKSQYAIDRCLQRAEAENRRVFYTNIQGLNIPGWEKFDPLEVKTDENNVHRYKGVPDGSLLVMDEASYIFEQRKGTEAAPVHEKILTTHRHAGYDIYIVTQHPKDVTAYVRRRIEAHVHLVRKKGNNFAVTYTWTDGKEGEILGDKIGNAHHATTGVYRYRPEIWGYYHSATIHTVHKRRWPLKVYLIPVIVLAFGVVLYWTYDLMANGLTGHGERETAVMGGMMPETNRDPNDQVMTPEAVERRRAKQGIAFTERRIQTVPGVPESEPRFAELVRQAKSYPRMQCVLYGHKALPDLKAGWQVDRRPVGGVCKCYSQQATRLVVDDDTCRTIVAQGYFDSGLPDTALEVGMAGGERAADSAAAAPLGGVEPGTRRSRQASFNVVGQSHEHLWDRDNEARRRDSDRHKKLDAELRAAIGADRE